MLESKEHIDLLGSILANINNILLTGIFIARLYKQPKIEYWLGVIFIVSIIPLLLMLLRSFEIERSFLYHVQLILIILFILIEFFLDYILKIEFRHNILHLIPYLTLFYASFGGMIGVAGHSGKIWLAITVSTFLIMTTVSLIVHFRTGT